MASRDVIVVGASSGGRAAVQQLVAGLPSDLPAAVLVVVHTSLTWDDSLPRQLDSLGGLPASHAVDGEEVVPGKIYCARPDRHLIVRDGRLRLSHGPKENRFRPAVDPLFRSAARSFGSRVIGVVLTGRLDDGSLGLALIKQRGGAAVVQSPDDAEAPGMPSAALNACAVDFVLPLREMGAVLKDLVLGDVDLPNGPSRAVDDDSASDDEIVDITLYGDQGLTEEKDLGPPAGFTCPDCGGALYERRDGKTMWHRCHVGHVFTEGGLAASQDEAVESALWTALRTLEEATAFRRKLVERMRDRGSRSLADSFQRDVEDYERQAATLRRLLIGD